MAGLTFQRHGLEGGMNSDFLGGIELHPLIRLAIDTASFSHVDDLQMMCFGGSRVCIVVYDGC